MQDFRMTSAMNCGINYQAIKLSRLKKRKGILEDFNLGLDSSRPAKVYYEK